MIAAQPASNILGISAKSLHRPKNQELAEPDRVEIRIKARQRRFDLLRQAQSLMFDSEKSPKAQARICWCHRLINTKGDFVGVYRTDGGTGARLAGVNTCGSVWSCPVCAAKITEVRRRELQDAEKAWLAKRGEIGFMTLTFPHALYEEIDGERRPVALAPQLEKFAAALQSFKNCKAYKRIMKDAGRAGNIRSLETTWGANGWHPHVHELVYLARELTITEIDTLKDEWAEKVIKRGLCERSKKVHILDHGLSFQDGRYAAEYAAKFGLEGWDLSAEMTKAHNKAGSAGMLEGDLHYTPMQLLAWSHAGDTRASALFREFSQAFQGKRMLSWSPGLADLLDVAVADLQADEDAAADAVKDEAKPGEYRIGEISEAQFAILLSRNRLGEFLAYVARCCYNDDTAQSDIDDYIESITGCKITHSSNYLKRNFMGSGFTARDEVLH